MFKNCKDCFLYDREIDDLYKENVDESPLEGSLPSDHFCIWYSSGIPKNIWRNIKECPHYEKVTD